MQKYNSYLRAGIFMALAITVVWQLVTRSFATYLAVDTPTAALSLRPTEPTALITLAVDRLRRLESDIGVWFNRWSGVAQKAGRNLYLDKSEQSLESLKPVERARLANPKLEIERIEELAQWALLSDPLNARAARILGQAALAKNDDERALRFMEFSARLSHHEVQPTFWLMLKKFQGKHYSAALRNADILLRKKPQLIENAMPILVRIVENIDANAESELKKLLRANPPWRASFFNRLRWKVHDPRTPLNLLLALNDTTAPPTKYEMREYMEFLVQREYYELAYYAWLQFLSPEQLKNVGFLINGSFERPPSGLPFDWMFPSGQNVTVDLIERTDQVGTRALFLRFGPGRVDLPGVSQLIALPPGTYQFQSKYQVDLKSRRGLQWKIRCAEGGSKLIGESPMVLGSEPLWRDLKFTFIVPESNCRVQKLRLSHSSRSASEQLADGTASFDDLAIRRVATPLKPQKAGDAPSKNRVDQPSP